MGNMGRFCQLALSFVALSAIAVGCGGSVTPAPSCPASTPSIRQLGIDKVDLLFAIDNSASMADKQAIFRGAIPELINALVAPDCSDGQGNHAKPTGSGSALQCPTGYQLIAARVHDLHIGIVTSSLGGGGAQDICETPGTPPPVGNRHDNDRGRLINRTKPASGTTEPPIANARPLDNNGGNFLAWLPPGEPKNAGKPDPNVTKEPDAAALTQDFQDLATGVQEYGCGLEAQLESWYRFLVQPDPYDTIKLDTSISPPKAFLDGVDATLLKQRKDFLRSDSLVAVIMLTDEEDSWSDPLALGGRGWATRTNKFPGSPIDGVMPKPTSECLEPVDPNNPTTTGPNNPSCTSCGFTGNKANGTAISADPNCQVPFYTAAEDGLNVRYTNDMKRRYGFDPQFPVQRYIDGLQSLKVPDRDGEHPGGGGSYKGTKSCTNPLFAKDLPDGSNLDPRALCELGLGQRTPDLVFFAILGGVPWQLLVEDPTNAASALKGSLGASDWVKILGKDPATYQQDGIDPHMIESITPRAGLPAPTAASDADPIHGREWNTSLVGPGLDLQYACTFPLPAPKDCTAPMNAGACDCLGGAAGPEGSPLCNGTTQVRGKAYPAIRELRVAQGLGLQGIVGSLCAVDPSAPSFAYRPVLRALVDRLTPVVTSTCDPTAHARGADGKVACRVFVSFEPGSNGTCDPARGLSPATGFNAGCYKETRLAELRQTNPSYTLDDVGPVCELAQIPASQYQAGTCEKLATPGWCYVVGSEAGKQCAQGVALTPAATPTPGMVFSVQCDP